MTRSSAFDRLPASIQEAAKRHPSYVAKERVKRRQAERPAGFDSKLEQRFSFELARRKAAGTVADYRHHALRLRLPGGPSYEPDFCATRQPWPAGLARLELTPAPQGAPPLLGPGATCYEVQAARNRGWRGHGSKEAQRVRMRVAAAVYPGLRLVVVEPEGDGWRETEITPTETIPC